MIKVKLFYILDGLKKSTFSADLHILMNYSFNEAVLIKQYSCSFVEAELILYFIINTIINQQMEQDGN